MKIIIIIIIKPAQTSANPGETARTRANPRKPAQTRANPREPTRTRANPRKPAQIRANQREPAQTRANPREPAQSNSDTIPATLNILKQHIYLGYPGIRIPIDFMIFPLDRCAAKIWGKV